MNNILLIGDIVIDKSYIGISKRFAPEGCFPVVNINSIITNIGCVGNVLNSLLDFFDKIYLITCLNENDIFYINEIIEKYTNVIHINFHQDNRRIIIKNRIYIENKCISRFDQEKINNIDLNNEEKILNYISTIINNINITILSDYAKGVLTYNLTTKIIELCNKNNIITLIDPKGNDYKKYKNATLIKPNKTEMNDFIYSELTDHNSKFAILLNEYNIKYILNTLGEDGMRLIYKNLNNKIEILNKDTIKSEIIDVTGCGDNILSSLAIFLKNENYSFHNVNFLLDILTHIGSISVNKPGCFKITKNIWNKFYIKQSIVFTNGCFDIIHIGHLKFLKECKKLGSKLIIGINTDESIKRIKGNKRPINKLEDRINFLKELDIADEIISFDEDTPEILLRKLKPDILVKGGDYNMENIKGKEYVKKTIIIPFNKGFSSANIINKCKDI